MKIVKTVFLSCFCSALFSSGHCLAQTGAADEIKALRQEFAAEVSAMTIGDKGYQDAVNAYSREKLAKSEHGQESQYFVFVDRNPKRQNIMVGFYHAGDGVISVIGWGKTSTGDPARREHYITPTGIFEISAEHIGYRALGTKNAKGWRGNGAKGMRIWTFWWQRTANRKGGTIDIMMQMHATDPKFGEPRLGTRDSMGCIRISGKMNKFIDVYGIIDKDILAHPEQAKRILSKDRKTVRFPGRYVIVGDFK